MHQLKLSLFTEGTTEKVFHVFQATYVWLKKKFVQIKKKNNF